MIAPIYNKKCATWRNRALLLVVMAVGPFVMVAIYVYWIVVGTLDGFYGSLARIGKDLRLVPKGLRSIALLVTTGRDLAAEEAEERRVRYFSYLPRRKEQGK